MKTRERQTLGRYIQSAENLADSPESGPPGFFEERGKRGSGGGGEVDDEDYDED